VLLNKEAERTLLHNPRESCYDGKICKFKNQCRTSIYKL